MLVNLERNVEEISCDFPSEEGHVLFTTAPLTPLSEQYCGRYYLFSFINLKKNTSSFVLKRSSFMKGKFENSIKVRGHIDEKGGVGKRKGVVCIKRGGKGNNN